MSDPERPKPVLSEPQGPAQPAVFSPALSEPKPEPVTPRCGGRPPVELLRCPITVTAGFQRVSSMHAVADILPWTKGGTPARSLASDAVSTCLSGSIIFTVAVVLSSHLDISAWHGLGCQTPSVRAGFRPCQQRVSVAVAASVHVSRRVPSPPMSPPDPGQATRGV